MQLHSCTHAQYAAVLFLVVAAVVDSWCVVEEEDLCLLCLDFPVDRVMPEVVVGMSNNIIEHVICVFVEAQHRSIYTCTCTLDICTLTLHSDLQCADESG